jgi:hypothetical protein
VVCLLPVPDFREGFVCVLVHIDFRRITFSRDVGVVGALPAVEETGAAWGRAPYGDEMSVMVVLLILRGLEFLTETASPYGSAFMSVFGGVQPIPLFLCNRSAGLRRLCAPAELEGDTISPSSSLPS